MKYKVHYTTAEGRTYSIDGAFYSCYSCLPKVLRVVRALDKYRVKHLEITLCEEMQRGGETGGIGGG